MERIKRKYHVVLLIHGQNEIVSTCDQLLTIINNKAQIGSIEDFIEKIPQSGEIFTIELNNPDREALNKMFDLKSAIFIEERKNEKYKIFTEENPDDLIQQLIALLGPSLYNLKRFKASMREYLEFLEYKQVK